MHEALHDPRTLEATPNDEKKREKVHETQMNRKQHQRRSARLRQRVRTNRHRETSWVFDPGIEEHRRRRREKEQMEE